MDNKCCGFMDRFSGFALTVVRIVLGVIFVVHGAHKVIGWPTAVLGAGGLANTLQGMGSMGMPAVLIYLVAFGELLGGLGLVLGIACRPAALGVMTIMIGAIVKAHGAHGFFLNWFHAPGVGHGYEYCLALIGMSLGVFLGGPGRLALCNLICRKGDGCCH